MLVMFSKIYITLLIPKSMDIDDIKKKRESRWFNLDTLDDHLDIEFIINTEGAITGGLYDKMLDVFGSPNNPKEAHRKAREYFYSRIPALGNKRPYDLCLEKRQNELYDELVRADYGIFS